MTDSIEPVHGVPPFGRIRDHGKGEYFEGGHQAPIRGQVIAVRQRNVHQDGKHLLDVSVGAEEHTEITVRVETGSVEGIEERHVVIYVLTEPET